MARPATPKLPVNKTLISEVLQRVSNAKTKHEKVQILLHYKSPALTKVLLCNFAKSVSFVFPTGKTPYQAQERPKGIGHTLLYNEQRMIEKFIKKTVRGVTYFGCSKGPRPSLQQLKKEQLWIQLLEGLHPDEAALMDLVKDKQLTSKYKITRQNVIDAFPELRLQDEQEPRPVVRPNIEPPVKEAVEPVAPTPVAEEPAAETPAEKPKKRTRRTGSRTAVRRKSVQK